MRETPKDAAYQIISDELMLDGNPRLNLASFVTTWMEPECNKLIMSALNKNYIDMDEYPITTELQVITTLCMLINYLGR
jgi:glutamate decarboxylase